MLSGRAGVTSTSFSTSSLSSSYRLYHFIIHTLSILSFIHSVFYHSYTQYFIIHTLSILSFIHSVFYHSYTQYFIIHTLSILSFIHSVFYHSYTQYFIIHTLCILSFNHTRLFDPLKFHFRAVGTAKTRFSATDTTILIPYL